MTFSPPSNIGIAVIGLGYVGLPLALSLARHFSVVGFDTDAERVEQLGSGADRTGGVAEDQLRSSALKFSCDPADLDGRNVFVVTVPTPIDESTQPDLTALRQASQEVGKWIAPGAVVVFESTVYPGVTEDICGREIEAVSGLRCGDEFFLGYSPERINPGDDVHTVENITKVVAGQTPEVARFLEEIYGAVIPAGVHVAPTIRTAEAAKVIENAQRDINIAFINEVTMIFQQMGIETRDVLAAANTKWNFLDFQPGLVGGHCIGVDPFYLAYAAKEIGHEPEIVLAGRRINDGMAGFVAGEIDKRIESESRILVLGLTFKENVPDLRNSKVVDMISALKKNGHDVEVYDPIAAPGEAKELYGLELRTEISELPPFDAIVGAVAHDEFRAFSATQITPLLRPDGLMVDLKGIWRDLLPAAGIRHWRL